jgi:hypothetical protein
MADPDRETPEPLRLLAGDEEDLKVLSAAAQDAVCTIGDIIYEAGARRLTVALNRFRWEAPARARGGERVRAGFQLGGVLSVQARGLRLNAKDGVLVLLSLEFEPAEAPAGVVVLNFAAGGALRAEVECIDAVLTDLSAPWPTPRRPSHEEAEN